MAAETAAGELTVRRLSFGGVTSRTLRWLGGTRMRQVAANAGLVSERRTGRFPLMTALTRRRYGAAVRFMAAAAVLVASVCVSVRVGVAVRAGDDVPGAGIMRQPAVAALAGSVTRARGGQGELLLVTALARRLLCQRELEVVRRMTALA
jgi:hypothetical protein